MVKHDGLKRMCIVTLVPLKMVICWHPVQNYNVVL